MALLQCCGLFFARLVWRVRDSLRLQFEHALVQCQGDSIQPGLIRPGPSRPGGGRPQNRGLGPVLVRAPKSVSTQALDSYWPARDTLYLVFLKTHLQCWYHSAVTVSYRNAATSVDDEQDRYIGEDFEAGGVRTSKILSGANGDLLIAQCFGRK